MLSRLRTLTFAASVFLLAAAAPCRADFDLLVASYNNSAIYNVDQAGNTTTFISSNVDHPIGLAINSTNGEIYVANNGVGPLINTVSEFTSSGAFVRSIGGPALNAPQGLALDSAGNLFVSNADSTISEFTSAGMLVRTVNSGLNDPYGMVVNGTTLFVADQTGNRIEMFSTTTGADLGVFTTTALDGPTGLAIGPNGHLFVTNFSGATVNPVDTITEYALNGTFIGTFASGANTGLDGPIGLAFGSTTNDLYVANNVFGGVERFAPDGTDLGDFTTTPAGPTFIAFRSVPEPTSLALIGMGLGGSFLYNRRRSVKAKASA